MIGFALRQHVDTTLAMGFRQLENVKEKMAASISHTSWIPDRVRGTSAKIDIIQFSHAECASPYLLGRYFTGASFTNLIC